MGLRLVAHYFDPVEALIAQSVINAVGMLSFLHGYDLATIRPNYTMAIGGYRLMVHADDVEAAVHVINEARANPIVEGARYVSSADSLDRALSLLVGFLAGGASIPMRRGVWSSD